MPYKSKAQQGFFHTKEGKAKVGEKNVREFDKASKGETDLPEHVKEKKSEPKKPAKTPPSAPQKGKDFGMFPGMP